MMILRMKISNRYISNIYKRHNYINQRNINYKVILREVILVPSAVALTCVPLVTVSGLIDQQFCVNPILSAGWPYNPNILASGQFIAFITATGIMPLLSKTLKRNKNVFLLGQRNDKISASIFGYGGEIPHYNMNWLKSIGLIVISCFGLLTLQNLYDIEINDDPRNNEFWIRSSIMNPYINKMMMFNVAILGPTVEEIMFRGVLFSRLLVYTNPIIAYIISSVTFTLMHADRYTPSALTHIFMAGIIFSAQYHLTGRLLIPILSHMIYNASSILADIFALDINSNTYTEIIKLQYQFLKQTRINFGLWKHINHDYERVDNLFVKLTSNNESKVLELQEIEQLFKIFRRTNRELVAVGTACESKLVHENKEYIKKSSDIKLNQKQEDWVRNVLEYHIKIRRDLLCESTKPCDKMMFRTMMEAIYNLDKDSYNKLIN